MEKDPGQKIWKRYKNVSESELEMSGTSKSVEKQMKTIMIHKCIIDTKMYQPVKCRVFNLWVAREVSPG